MHAPPFKLIVANRLLLESESKSEVDTDDPAPGTGPDARQNPFDPAEDDPGEAVPGGRARLADLDPNLHCSVIGTCLSTFELRKLMARFVFVRDASDLEVHHEAVSFATRGGAITKALGKALDKRHASALQRFNTVHDVALLETRWEEALTRGEVAGAYWAVLTHRAATPALRERVFGDIHMLSHLVAAANLADIRRQAALERENAELREKTDRQQQRLQESQDERQHVAERLEQALADAARAVRPGGNGAEASAEVERLWQRCEEESAAAARTVALQTERRERAEQAATGAIAEATRLSDELDHLSRQVSTLVRELDAAETQMREIGDGGGGSAAEPARALASRLRGRRILYVGGRPSSATAIRDLVLRHGGEFQRHDGGFEDRKGLLAAGVAWAELVVFPVDCVDHDSAGNLKRLCGRQQVAYLPLRSASVASFAAAFSDPVDERHDGQERAAPNCCRKHG